jgi:hypothetical protein
MVTRQAILLYGHTIAADAPDIDAGRTETGTGGLEFGPVHFSSIASSTVPV